MVIESSNYCYVVKQNHATMGSIYRRKWLCSEPSFDKTRQTNVLQKTWSKIIWLLQTSCTNLRLLFTWDSISSIQTKTPCVFCPVFGFEKNRWRSSFQTDCWVVSKSFFLSTWWIKFIEWFVPCFCWTHFWFSIARSVANSSILFDFLWFAVDLRGSRRECWVTKTSKCMLM